MYSAWRIGVVFTASNMTGGAFSGLMANAMAAHSHLTATQQVLSNFFSAAETGFMRFGKSAVNAFFQAADAAGRYQLTMRLVQQQLQASGPTMEKIGTTITGLSVGSTRTIFSREELAGMVRELQQSGLTVSQINRIMPQIAYGAEIEKMRGGSGPQMFAKYLGSTIKGYGLADSAREKDFAKFIDTYTRVASVTHMDASGLRSIEARVGGTARLFGISAQDFITGSGWLTQRGIQPNEVGTIWRNILTNVIPHAGLTSHAAQAQYQSLMMLGLLKPPDPANAKKYLGEYMRQQKALGFISLDPAHMTAKQQEAFAQGLMRATTGSNVLTGNLADMFTKLHASFLRFRELFGVRNAAGQITDDRQARQIYEQAVRQAFNLRGMQGALLMAFEGGQSYAAFKAQAAHQAPLAERAQQLRYTYATMRDMLPKQFTTLLQILGGVSPGGKTVPGGPLDVMTNVMKFLTDFIAKLSDFGTMHPLIMAKLGTLIGVAGIGGITIASGFAVANLFMLNRAILALGAAAAVSGGASVAKGGMGLANTFLMGANFAKFGGVIGAIRAVVTAPSFMSGIVAGLGAVARLLVVGFVRAFPIGALITALVLVWKNPEIIGQWVGAVQGFLQYRLVPGFTQGLDHMKTALSSWWATSFIPWWTNLWTNLLHFKLPQMPNVPGNVASALQDWWSRFNTHRQAAVDQQRQAIVAPGATNSHLQHGGGGHTVHVGDINVTSHHADPNKVADAVIEKIERRLPFSLRTGGTSYNSPRMPAFATNGGVA